MDIAKAIKIARVHKNIKAKDISEIFNLPNQNVSRLLKKSDFKINKELIPILDALGYDLRISFVDRDSNLVIDVQ